MPPLRGRAAGRAGDRLHLVSMSVSLLAVFIPILLMGGIVGRLFREFAVTLAVAITVSVVVSLTTDADDVRALAPPASTDAARAGSTGSERVFERMLGGYGAHAHVRCCATGGSRCASALAHGRAQRLPLRRRPQGLLPAAGQRPARGIIRGAAGRLVPGDDGAARSQVEQIVRRGPGRRQRRLLHRRRAAAARANTGARVRRAQAARRAQGVSADEIIARLRPKLAQVAGRQPLPPGGPGRARRRARWPRPVPVHAPGRRTSSELNDLGAARARRRSKKMPELRDVGTDQQTGGLAAQRDIDRDTAARLGRDAAADRQHALRRLRPAAGRAPCTRR